MRRLESCHWICCNCLRSGEKLWKVWKKKKNSPACFWVEKLDFVVGCNLSGSEPARTDAAWDFIFNTILTVWNWLQSISAQMFCRWRRERNIKFGHWNWRCQYWFFFLNNISNKRVSVLVCSFCLTSSTDIQTTKNVCCDTHHQKPDLTLDDFLRPPWSAVVLLNCL